MGERQDPWRDNVVAFEARAAVVGRGSGARGEGSGEGGLEVPPVLDRDNERQRLNDLVRVSTNISINSSSMGSLYA